MEPSDKFFKTLFGGEPIYTEVQKLISFLNVDYAQIKKQLTSVLEEKEKILNEILSLSPNAFEMYTTNSICAIDKNHNKIVISFSKNFTNEVTVELFSPVKHYQPVVYKDDFSVNKLCNFAASVIKNNYSHIKLPKAELFEEEFMRGCFAASPPEPKSIHRKEVQDNLSKEPKEEKNDKENNE